MFNVGKVEQQNENTGPSTKGNCLTVEFIIIIQSLYMWLLCKVNLIHDMRLQIFII